jgi:hypothetical protein
MDKIKALEILKSIACYSRGPEKWMNVDIDEMIDYVEKNLLPIRKIIGDGKNRCQTCGRILDKREIALFDGMVKSLFRVYKWCVEKNKNEFTRKEIEHLLLDGNQKERFGDWVLFGGLVYKNGKAKYGLNMTRCDAFFTGKMNIPSRVWKDPITKEIIKVDYKSINQIPGLVKFLDEDGFFKAKYASAGQLVL